ncbi:18326_t:CDS:2 [Funneliformis geosporum]|uniref:D-lactate dehydratase n=1 Tax=Funneliformis geosporum TaxID=1117311 RepID=A0A9W4SGH7_9GLOM|nr:10508_t:CDS:2 [Funneliformis geosporum]CAI2167102.1 18326_t:CDS:2 [Funneliformis geosporum]
MANLDNKKALVLVADGSEEMETVITIDVLRRAQIDVTVAGIALQNENYAKCSRGVMIVPDQSFSNISKEVLSKKCIYDIIIIPGGLTGAQTISSNSEIQELLASEHRDGKFIAAICAGTIAIKSANINKGGKITSHPVVKADLENEYNYQEERVVVDNKVISSRGPGTAFLFALTIVEQLLGKEKRDEISSPMILASTL